MQMMIGKRPLRTQREPANLFRLARTDMPGHFLRYDAKGVVKGTAWSWLGNRDQAQCLAERAAIRGQDWPYALVHQSLCDKAASDAAIQSEDQT